jgi:uncharacterized cupin superfamily protein
MDVQGIAQMEDAPRRDVDAGPMGGNWWDLGRAGGSLTTGLRRIQVTPGRRATPAHAHDAEEEIFYVLGGAGLSWQDGKTCRVGQGDCIVHPAGGPAHTLIAGADGVDVLAFGTRRDAAACRLPRAGVAWLGDSWVTIGEEPHPWAREAAAGELDCPDPGERFASVVATAEVEAIARKTGDTDRLVRMLGRAAGARLSGLNHFVVRPGGLGCPPHVHAAEEEIFVVLEGEGTLDLYECGAAAPEAPRKVAVGAGTVVVRVAGSAVAHAFRAGPGGLTLLAYGERRTDEMTFYPRSRKLSFRGLGVIGRMELCEYWDGEPPAD